METVWAKVKDALRGRIPDCSFRMWIEPLKLKQDGESIWVLTCPNVFSQRRIRDKYGAMIESEIQAASGKACRITFRVSAKRGRSKSDIADDPQPQLPNDNLSFPSGHRLRKDFTFDYFFVVDNNNFAYSASRLFASPKDPHQNSLVLLSKTGMGKSHLSQAIGHHVLSEYPDTDRTACCHHGYQRPGSIVCGAMPEKRKDIRHHS